MATTTSSPIKTKARTIDGLSIRYAESAPREGVPGADAGPLPG